MTDGEDVTACPHCDSTAIRTRKPGHLHSKDRVAGSYHCDACRRYFDQPRTRERRHTSSPSPGTMAAALLAADPDDVLGGESA